MPRRGYFRRGQCSRAMAGMDRQECGAIGGAEGQWWPDHGQAGRQRRGRVQEEVTQSLAIGHKPTACKWWAYDNHLHVALRRTPHSARDTGCADHEGLAALPEAISLGSARHRDAALALVVHPPPFRAQNPSATIRPEVP